MSKLTTFARVRGLNEWHGACFSAALLARMVPNFKLFAEVTEHENPDVLDKVFALIRESLVSPKSKINFALQREKVEENAPDIAQFDMFGVYPANDACMATVATLNLLAKEDSQGAVVVSKLSQGGVEAYLLANGEADDSNVKSHPLMEYEVALQNELIDALEKAPSNKDTLKICLDIALSENMTNIGLALD
jgi:uncharacterized protein YjaG (DUF416 family)